MNLCRSVSQLAVPKTQLYMTQLHMLSRAGLALTCAVLAAVVAACGASYLSPDPAAGMAGMMNSLLCAAAVLPGLRPSRTHNKARDMDQELPGPVTLTRAAGGAPLNGDVDRTAIESRLLGHIALIHETCPEGRILRVNATMCAKTGFSSAELIGSAQSVFHPELDENVAWHGLHTLSGEDEIWTGETLNRTKDGSDLWLSTTAEAIRAGDGTLLGYYYVSLDITETKRLHEEFQRSGKLMQLGQLTAMVAHEIRNPLGAIRTANFVLERKLKGQVDGVEPQLERINVSIRRCDKIITELLDFSRKKTIKTAALPVDSWLAETIEEITKNLPAQTQVSSELSLGSLVATFDPDQMRQVVINLLSNAAEAMGEKIKSGTAELGYQPRIDVKSRQDGKLVQIIVSDNGPGIERKNIKRVREPLFTTKSFGVGLGISAIEKILQDHHGHLGIESAPGAGATMTASFHQDAGALAQN